MEVDLCQFALCHGKMLPEKPAGLKAEHIQNYENSRDDLSYYSSDGCPGNSHIQGNRNR